MLCRIGKEGLNCIMLEFWSFEIGDVLVCFDKFKGPVNLRLSLKTFEIIV